MGIKVLLESGEGALDFVGAAEVGDGVGDGVVVFEAQEGGEFLLVEFFDAHGDVVGEDKVEEYLLLGAEPGVDIDAGMGGADFAGLRGHGVGDVGQNVKEVAVLGIDDFLHLSQLVFAEAFFRQSGQKTGTGVRGAPDGAKFFFVVEELREFAEEKFHELLGGHGSAVRMPEAGDHHVLDVTGFAVSQLDS